MATKNDKEYTVKLRIVSNVEVFVDAKSITDALDKVNILVSFDTNDDIDPAGIHLVDNSEEYETRTTPMYIDCIETVSVEETIYESRKIQLFNDEH